LKNGHVVLKNVLKNGLEKLESVLESVLERAGPDRGSWCPQLPATSSS
jgi:hypothetical protein